MALTEVQLNEFLGRPKTFQPVQVQGRLPWVPRRSDGRVQVVLCHPLVADVFVNTCHEAAERSAWVPRRIDSYNPREIRGYKLPSGWRLGDKGTSRHGWAVAWDFFSTWADVPPPGGVWTPDNPVPADFASAFEETGFIWGRRWSRRDDPHIELGVRPATGPDFDVDFLSGLLKQGDVGEEVRRLQFTLRAIGQDVEPSGVFDSVTHGVVIAVQTAGKTSVDGIVGPKTEAVMIQMIISKYAGKIADLVNAAYQDVLGRPADETGSAYYVKKVSTGEMRVHHLWEQLWDSGEGIRYRAGLSVAPLQKRITELEAHVTEQGRTIGDLSKRMATIKARAEKIVEAATPS